MKKLSHLLLLIFITKLSFSQSYNYNQVKEFIVSGIISSLESEEVIEYATITLLNPDDNSVITGGISDNSGNFSFPARAGKYNILIEFISFKNYNLDNVDLNMDLDLGNIKLELDYESLGEVEIIAEETSVEIRLDKKIYTVGKDLTVRGGTGTDVLDNIPSVSTQIDGNILLRGHDAARILINGKPKVIFIASKPYKVFIGLKT